MSIDELREYCFRKPGTTEEMPFGPDTLVIKVLGKIYLMISLDERPLRLSMKCDPERIPELRAQYPAISTGPYLNPKHWNSMILDGSLSRDLVLELLDLSYNLVVNGLTKKQREILTQAGQA
jgi:predicted DNA-binding protein (MmcQ/YjbR family)